jgi:hypothetical protein
MNGCAVRYGCVTSRTCNALLCIKVYAYLLAGNIVKILELLLAGDAYGADLEFDG